MSNAQVPDERREQIVSAALACFLQFGFAKTSLDDIAKRAGISRPLVYRKFANKGEILGAVYDSVHEACYPKLDKILAGRASKAAKLREMTEVVLVEPWGLLHGAPALDEFFRACDEVIPEVYEKHHRKVAKYVEAVIADRERAEVFMLAVEGFYLDMPTMATFRRRIHILIDAFL